MSTKLPTLKFMKPLLCSASLVAVCAAGPVHAQAADSADTDSVTGFDEIVITGTRVRGTKPVGSDVISVGREEMEASASVTIDRMLKEIPQVYDLGVSENSRGQAGGNGNIAYGNSVNLRGIGPYATLVLIDGHRVVNNSRSIDPSVMPTLGVERVEVVADGASAVYGSDAVAGVVNIIPRRTLDGGEVLARYGFSDDGKFDEYQIGGAFGQTWDGGQFMVAFEHVSRSNLSGDDRDFFTNDQTEFGGNDYSITRCAPGTIRTSDTTYAIPAGGLTDAAALVGGTTNTCDSNIGQDLFPEQEYNSFNGTFTQDIMEGVSFFADAFYSKRTFTRLPAHATASLTIPETNAFFVRPDGFTGTSYTVDYNFMNDLPQNASVGFAESWQVTPGLRISLPFDWRFEGTFSYGETRDTSDTVYGLARNLTPFLSSSDPDVAFDPYGLGRTSQDTLDSMANQIFLAPTNMDFTGYELKLDGTLFSLPGGDVNMAVGYEGQNMDVGLGLGRGNPGTPIAFRDFSRKVDSVYAEVIVPLFGAENAIPGMRELVLNIAVRHDDYDDVGSTTNPKFGINWSPVENLTVRASYGTSFRAPLISQIYGNSNALFGQNYQNPDGGAPLLGFAQSGPNLGLGPETATTWSMGVDWDVNADFNLSLTYFDVEYKNQVETYLADLAILTRSSQFEGTGIILRGQEAADRVAEIVASGIPVARGAFPGGDVNNVDLYVDGRNNNLGVSKTGGIDFQATYQLETADTGSFTFNVGGTYLTKYKSAVTEAADLVDLRNTLFQPLKFKARASVAWAFEPFYARILATHVGSYTNTAVTPTETVSSYTPIDLSLIVDLGGNGALSEGLTLGLDVRNVFDIDPPYVNLAPGGNGSGGYDAAAANPIGRQIGISLRKKW